MSRLDADQRLTIHAGRGDNREHLALEGPQSDEVLAWLLTQTAPRTGEESAQVLADKAGLDVDEAFRFIEAFVKADVLVDEATAAELSAIIKRWGEHGWRDAVDFHLTTYGTTFVPDSADGLTYVEHFTELLANPGPAGPQPEHYEPRSASAAISWVGDSPGGMTLQEVLENACPINRFTGIDVTLADLLPPLTDAFATQRVVGGTLGAHQLRSYPSGGARHPFEAYIVSKGIDGLEVGSYYFDPLTHELQPVSTDLDPARVDRACFGKGGIVSARVVVVITCRWLRHSWKYRYPRSYRMLLMELGHISQAINLSMLAAGLQVYHCPPVDDLLWQELLDLADDADEGVMYALGVGRKGVR